SMADLHGFNANDIEPSANFEPLPAGSYLAAITESEMMDTKAGTGQYVKLTFQVLDGPSKGASSGLGSTWSMRTRRRCRSPAPSYPRSAARSVSWRPMQRPDGSYRWVPGLELDSPPNRLPEPPAWLAEKLDRLATSSPTSAHGAAEAHGSSTIP